MRLSLILNDEVLTGHQTLRIAEAAKDPLRLVICGSQLWTAGPRVLRLAVQVVMAVTMAE